MTDTQTTRKYIVASDVGGTCTDTIVIAVGDSIQYRSALATAAMAESAPFGRVSRAEGCL